MLEFYDSLFRYWAVGLFMLIGIFVLRQYGLKLAPILASLSSFSAASYLLGSQTPGLVVFGWAYPVPLFLGMFGTIFVWLFSLSQFEDDFHIGPLHYGVSALYAIGYSFQFGVVSDIVDVGWYDVGAMMTSLRFFVLAHMLYVAWKGRDEDLLEMRRQFRTMYIILVSIVTATITIIETWFWNFGRQPEVLLFQAVSFVALGMVLIWRSMEFRHRTILVANGTKGQGRPEPEDPSDRIDLARITDMVTQKKVYLEPGLTVAVLAEKLGLPEHRLRRLVNQHMGFRNFADFLNEYRVAAARQKLSDIQNRNEQILVIAMDLGYGSLGPFNRAFKERTGLTPSEFRKKALAKTEK